MNSIKIAKLTLDGYVNYGNLLQSYALQQILLNYADTVDSIWHSPDNFLPKIWWRWNYKFAVKFVLNWRDFRTDILHGRIGGEMVRQGKLKDWADRHIHMRTDVKDLHTIADDYDHFVVGSDQVWNPRFGDLQQNFLQFAPREKRLSYAASIAAPEIPPEKLKLYQDGLSEMKAVSMREEEGAAIVREITGRDVPVHVDPTLLLTPDEWRAVSRPPAWYHGDDYVLTYFLGTMPDAVSEAARASGLPVVDLLDSSVYEHYVTGVDEFIWAIEHARLVYTDSFHGTVFSILFRRPFVVCDRKAADGASDAGNKMSSRIDTLLALFGLEHRRALEENRYRIEHPLVMEYPNIDTILSHERMRTDVYIREAMNLDEKGISFSL